jgi:eukaryotic-like serine/threonine-protein kinase
MSASMTPERWERIRSVVERALEAEPNQRTALLDKACSSDPSMRHEVEALLDLGKDVASSFLESPPEMDDAWMSDIDAASSAHGLHAGQVFAERFQLLRKLGEGGMGQVWLSEQTSPVRRQVALKFIRAGMYDESIVKRFQAERQSLAMMDHPSIAKVFDAGTTPQGQPYFVMEYVPGLPITEYCDQKKLKIPERLELLILVCEAVQHAHQKAIIHRDLKPANILVVEIDGKPIPRIIDFGLAKAARAGNDGQSIFTEIGQFVGTPGYMSPEQADPNVQDIDTRTDVYSLGVVLYVLLTGARPFDTKAGDKLPLDELLRKLREGEPPTPSNRVSSATSRVAAEARGTDPKNLISLLRGDLDWIALKALEKNRDRRYGTPSELAADIQRYLKHEAVLAAPPSLAYRTRKFARRYRVVLASAGVIALVLVVAAVISIRQGIRANREAAVAEAVNDFLQNDLLAQAGVSAQSSPNTKLDPDLKVRTALDRAAERIEGKFTKQPGVEASIRDTLGWTYRELGLLAESRKQLERSVELGRRVLGVDDHHTLKSMEHLARLAALQGKYAESEMLEEEIFETRRRVLGPRHPDTLLSMCNLGDVYNDEGKYAQAESLLTESLEMQERSVGPEHADTLRSMRFLAEVYESEGKYPQAEVLDTQALEILRRVAGPEYIDTADAIGALASIYDDEGKYAQAETLYAQLLEIRTRLWGPEHLATLRDTSNLARVYVDDGKYAQADAVYTQVLEKEKRVMGLENPDTLMSMHNLANAYMEEGKYAQAETLGMQTWEIKKRVLGPEHPDTALTVYNLGCVAAHRGDKDKAIALLRQSVDHGLYPYIDMGIEKDTDLTSLHGDPRFAALVAHAKEVAATKQKATATQKSE